MNTNNIARGKRAAGVLATLLITALLGACGGGEDGGTGGGTGGGGTTTSNPPSDDDDKSIGGTVAGLTGTGLVLNNNGSDALTVSANGAFTFARKLAEDATFNVTIANQPASPVQTCVVAGGSGVVDKDDITSVVVNCTDGVAGGGEGDQFGSGPDPSPAPSGNPTSARLISNDLAATKISKEQALIYEMYADFNDPRLPAAYRGDDAGIVEGRAFDRAADYIAATGEANVAPATLEALRPFITPPYYAGSHWQPVTAPAPVSGAVAGARLAAAPVAAAATPTKTGWVPVTGTHVVVWYKDGNAGTDLLPATTLVREFDATIWPKLTTLMGRTPKSDLGTGGLLQAGLLWEEDDGRLDVSLDDIKDEGKTIPTSWRTKNVATRIFLKRTLPMRGLIAQAAHEFMHAIQFSYDVKAASINDYSTTKEATAAWASHYVYPANRWETAYARHYLQESHAMRPYDDTSEETVLFRYGAYVFPLFQETRFGADVVKKIWDATLTFSKELLAIESAIIGSGSNFYEEWRRFVAANWNRDTIKPYAPYGVTIGADPEEVLTPSLANGFGAVKHAVQLPHASMAFYRVVLSGSNLRSLTFVNGLTYVHRSADQGEGNMLLFTGMDKANRDGASMQIYLKVNGTWQSSAIDFTNATHYSVCRDDPAGKIEEVVFMYGNGEITESKPNYRALNPILQPPGMVITDIGCRDWTGSLSMTRAFDDGPGSETLTLTNVKLVNTMTTEAPTPGPGPSYLLAPGDETNVGFGFTYKTAAGTAKWEYHKTLLSPANCEYDGSKTFTLDGPAHTSHVFSNWTPPGSAARGVIINQITLPALLTVAGLSVDWRCTGGDGKITTGTDVVGTSLDIFTTFRDASVRVAPGGLGVSGTGAQSVQDGATGTWTFTGSTQ